jgi:hypothetical protein
MQDVLSIAAIAMGSETLRQGRAREGSTDHSIPRLGAGINLGFVWVGRAAGSAGPPVAVPSALSQISDRAAEGTLLRTEAAGELLSLTPGRAAEWPLWCGAPIQWAAGSEGLLSQASDLMGAGSRQFVSFAAAA